MIFEGLALCSLCQMLYNPISSSYRGKMISSGLNRPKYVLLSRNVLTSHKATPSWREGPFGLLFNDCRLDSQEWLYAYKKININLLSLLCLKLLKKTKSIGLCSNTHHIDVQEPFWYYVFPRINIAIQVVAIM